MENKGNQDIKKVSISLIPFLAEAFSVNNKIYKDIDKIYNADRMKFIEFAKKDIYYNHSMSEEGNIEQEYYFKKALGLLNASKNDDNLANEVFNICKKGWKYAYTFVQQNNSIKTSVFLEKISRKYRGTDEITDDNFNSNIVVLLFLSQYFDKNIDQSDSFYNLFIETCIKRLAHYEKKNRINIDNSPKEKIKELRKLELKILNENKIELKPFNYKANNKEIEGIKLNADKLSEEDKYFIAFEYIFDLENISVISIIGGNYFNSKEIQELLFCYSQFYKDTSKINYEELKKYLYSAIQIRYLCREYKKAKKYFFKNFNDELYGEIYKIQNENKNIKKNNLLLQDESERLKAKIEELERENRRLKKEIEETDNNKSELTALREHVFNLSKEETFTEKAEFDYTLLNEYKGVIIGGHKFWQNKLKDILKQWIFISTETINFDENILKNSDYIFINVSCMSHAMYYKIMSIVNKNKKSINFIGTENIKLCLDKIYKKIDM